jgi:hypothetical protein
MLIQYILIIFPPPKNIYCFCVTILLFLSHNKLYPNDQINCFVIYACIFLFSTIIQTDHNEDEDNNDVDGNVTEHPRRLGREQAFPRRIKENEVYVTVEEEDDFMLIGGPVEKLPCFQIAPRPILNSPIHSNSSQ